MYQVYDRQTQQNMGQPCKTLRGALSKMHRLDNEYGAYRYGYRRIEAA